MNLAVFDAIYCLALIGLAVSALQVREVFSGVVLFITFGLFLALAWARLNAPDLALTEAALGAGLVGALFLAAQHRVEADGERAKPRRAGESGSPARFLMLLIVAPVIYVTCADWVHLGERAVGEGLTGPAYEALPRSGVSNPVTAALLNYRAYDTLLEVCVLLLALLAVYALHPERTGTARAPIPRDEILWGYGRLVGPIMVVVAGYILWAGSHRAGGAFQAGSILAGGGVLVLLAADRSRIDFNRRIIRVALVAGFTAFALIGALLVLQGPGFLTWPKGYAKPIMLTVETAATLSIGLTLVLLFAACADLLIPVRRQKGRR